MAVSSDSEFWQLPPPRWFSPPPQWRKTLLQSIKRALFWAVLGSLLLHVYLLTQLPDLSAPEVAEESAIQYEVTIIPEPERPEPVTPEVVPPQPAEPLESEAPPPTLPPEPQVAPAPPAQAVIDTQPEAAVAPPAVEPLDVITTEPADDSPSTWTWREQLLKQGNHLAPEAEADNRTANTGQDGQVPSNWVEPLLPDQSSWFEQFAPPGSVEQKAWRESNGTVRLETTLPNGQRMCGRAQPADPLQPLSFSIPVWTTCGKVRGKAAQRNALRRPAPKKRSAPPPP